MAFDFSEEKIEEMYGMYQQVLNSLHEEINAVTQSFCEKAEKMRYEPMVKLCIAATDYCDKTLKDDIKKAMNEWQQSEQSFSKVMDTLGAGEAAIDRGRKLEQRISETVNSWKGVDGSGLKSISTANANVREEDFEEIEKMVSGCSEKLEQSREEYAKKIGQQKEENTIYVSIEPVILSSIAIVSNGFDTAIRTSFNELKRIFGQRDRQAKTIGNNTAQAVSGKMKSIVEQGASKLRSEVQKIIN